MRDPETTRRTPAEAPAGAERRARAAGLPGRGARLVLVVLAALAAGACVSSPKEVGRPPEGEIRPDETTDERIARERRERSASDATTVPDPTADASRIGVRATHKFHRRGCALLAKVPAEGQEDFRSSWDAINADYAPCTQCKSGPDPDDGR